MIISSIFLKMIYQHCLLMSCLTKILLFYYHPVIVQIIRVFFFCENWSHKNSTHENLSDKSCSTTKPENDETSFMNTTSETSSPEFDVDLKMSTTDTTHFLYGPVVKSIIISWDIYRVVFATQVTIKIG